ncbi:MAG: FAD-dependent monooxygenase [Rhodobacteraceae bacterium]|nr:FAD-dependent monooxygenase [Paracoccaceae bacterium]
MPQQAKEYPFVPPPGLDSKEPSKKVVIVGAGPIGLAMAIELANHDIPSVILDDSNRVSTGSKAICWSKRSLEIFDRLGIGDKALAKGVMWKVGRTYHRDQELFNFDLLPEEGHKYPAFVNLQQYYVEEYLIARAQSLELIDLRFQNRVESIQGNRDSVSIDISTPVGDYQLETDYLIACDGVRSTVRRQLGLDFVGELFEERFLIADIEMHQDFPPERRFWFEPVFHEGQSALLHKQPDNIYRIDLQLGWDADPELEKQPERVIPRIRKVVGTSDFKIDWVSVYTFQCRRLERFVHGRVIFAGDSAHVVSPFGARGGNGGLQDVDNLGWKLAAIIKGRSTESLLETYNDERVYASDENIAHSTRTTKFMTPSDGVERMFRDQLFKLTRVASFARNWINPGRLSVPAIYPGFEDPAPELPSISRPGSVAPDAHLEDDTWLLDKFGKYATIFGINTEIPEIDGLRKVCVTANEFIRTRYLGENEKAIYLIRPDQVIASRWLEVKPTHLRHEINRIWGLDQ